MPLDGADRCRLAWLRAKRLNGSHTDAKALAQPAARDVRPCGEHGCSTSPDRIGRTTAQVDERKRGRRRVGQDVEIDRSGHVEGARLEVPVQVLSANPRQMRASAIQIELMPRVLPMSVVEGVVGVLLIVERSDAGTFEPGGKTELPHECALDVACKRARGSAVRRERRMQVVIGGAERQEPALLALRAIGGERELFQSAAGEVAIGRSSSSRMVT